MYVYFYNFNRVEDIKKKLFAFLGVKFFLFLNKAGEYNKFFFLGYGVFLDDDDKVFLFVGKFFIVNNVFKRSGYFINLGFIVYFREEIEVFR